MQHGYGNVTIMIRSSAIRELAASENATSIAAAYFESTVQIWDWKTQKDVCEFSTLFCAGAKNLALAPDGEILATGLSRTRGTIATYEIPSGKKIWERQLAYPSSLRFDPIGQSILCIEDRKSILRLEAHSGEIIETIPGIIRYISGPNGDSLTVPVQKNSPYRLIAGGRCFDIGRLGFALLDATFSLHFICLTEAKGPVRCIGRDDGKQQWMCDFGSDSHVLRLHYSSRLDAIWGVVQQLNKENSKYLVKIDITDGAYERVCDLGSWEEIFLDAADQLITSTGEIRDLSTGVLVGRLAFPLKEYPDE